MKNLCLVVCFLVVLARDTLQTSQTSEVTTQSSVKNPVPGNNFKKLVNRKLILPLRISRLTTTRVSNGWCGRGMLQDASGICQTPIAYTAGESGFDLDFLRKRRSIRNGRPRMSCPSGFYLDRQRNCRRKPPLARFSPRTRPTHKPSGDRNERVDKTVAGDGFGHVKKDCGSLVPGMVPDGVGGCTKAVRLKEKILRADRRK